MTTEIAIKDVSMDIKAVIFDLDNTLYNENTFIFSVCQEFCRRYDLPQEHISYILDDEFRLSSQDIFGDWLKQLDFYTQQKQEELFLIYKTISTTISLYPDACDFLAFLQSKSIKIGILTNGNIHVQQHKIKLLGLDKYIVEYARLHGIQHEKPHIDAFERVLKQLHQQAQKCIFVGDNPMTDIVGANKAQIFSVWLQRGYTRLMACDYADMNIVHFDELRRLWS